MWFRILPDSMMIIGGIIVLSDLCKKFISAKKPDGDTPHHFCSISLFSQSLLRVLGVKYKFYTYQDLKRHNNVWNGIF